MLPGLLGIENTWKNKSKLIQPDSDPITNREMLSAAFSISVLLPFRM